MHSIEPILTKETLIVATRITSIFDTGLTDIPIPAHPFSNDHNPIRL